jgi:outer membrane protein TolC
MGAYEDPQLEMGFFLEPMDIVGGREIAQFHLMQMFPWFGPKKAARTEAQHMANMAFEAFREAKDNLYLEVYTQWYALCNGQQKLINQEESKQLLQELETLALRKFATGNSQQSTANREPPTVNRSPLTVNRSMGGMNMGANSTSPANSPSGDLGLGAGGMNMGNTSASGMSEVLRIQLEIMELESNSESVRSEIKAGKVRFNALLNRPADSEVVLPTTISQLEWLLDVATVVSAIQAKNPMLGMLQQESEAYEAQAEMNKKMGYPMFGIGLQYMLIGKSPASKTNGSMNAMDNMESNASAMTGMNGKDMIMPMLSVSIPVYRHKYKAAIKESKLLRRAGEEKWSDAFNRLQADLFQFKHQLDDASRKIALYRKQAELARTTYDLVVREFTTGKSDLSAVIQIQRQLLDYQLKEAEAIAGYNTMAVNIQKIMSSYETE